VNVGSVIRLTIVLCALAGSNGLRLSVRQGNDVRHATRHGAMKMDLFDRLKSTPKRHGAVVMGLFDSLKSAFSNEEFKEDDQRVRASHILVKGEDDVERIVSLMSEIGQKVGTEPSRLGPVFAEVARRESACASAAQGGDLGLFGPGKMVREFDEALFPEDAAPPPGALLGTDTRCTCWSARRAAAPPFAGGGIATCRRCREGRAGRGASTCSDPSRSIPRSPSVCTDPPLARGHKNPLDFHR